MRITRFRVFLLLGGSLLLLGPAVGLGQPGNWGGQQGDQQGGGRQGRRGGWGGPGGGFQGGPPGGGWQGGGPGGPGGGRMGGFRMDPNQIFSMLAPNSDFLTETQYLANSFVSRDPNAKDRIESFMQRNGITNGGLTRDQFAQFFQERMAQRQAERAAANPDQQNGGNPNSPTASTDPNADPDEPPPPEDKRPVVYRAGNLPTDVPSWFAALDTDRDGQVGLYEWKNAGRSVSDFQALDLNGDGFITIEEAERYQKTQATAVASNGAGQPSFGQPSFGGQQGGFGRQGFNRQGFNGQGFNGQGGQGFNGRRRGGGRNGWQGGGQPQQGYGN